MTVFFTDITQTGAVFVLCQAHFFQGAHAISELFTVDAYTLECVFDRLDKGRLMSAKVCKSNSLITLPQLIQVPCVVVLRKILLPVDDVFVEGQM